MAKKIRLKEEIQETENEDRDKKFDFLLDDLIKDTNRKPFRKGKVLLIVLPNILVEIEGNGETIPFDPEKHSLLKVGDDIEI